MADNTQLNTGLGGDIIAADDIGGVKFQRIKLIHGINDINDGDVAKANPLPVQIINTAKSEIRLSAVGITAAAAITMVPMIKQVDASAQAAAASSFAVTNGKRFKITHISFATRNSLAATAPQATTFNLHVNPTGAAGTGSSIVLTARSATLATVGAWDRYVVVLPTDGIEIPGSTGANPQTQFGVSALSSFTTNAPTLDVLILGYEY